MADRRTVISYQQEERIKIENEAHLETVVATFLPDMYRTWQIVKLYNINTEVIPAILKAVADVCSSSRSGKVIIEIEADSVTGKSKIKAIKGLDVYKIDIDADLNT